MKTVELEANLAELAMDMAPLAVLVSGGADSALLADVAAEALPKKDLLLLHALLPFSPERETDYIKSFAKQRGTRLLVKRIDLLDHADIAANPSDRCYHCKKQILESVLSDPALEDVANIADGTVTDDFGDYRPGLRATDELGVRHPLAELGFGKREVRRMARRRGLANWNQPASACLASRIPVNSPITPEKIARIAAAETLLENLGFSGCRVRHLDDKVALVEVAQTHLGKLARSADAINAKLAELKFKRIEFAPEGYKKGAMNSPAKT